MEEEIKKCLEMAETIKKQKINMTKLRLLVAIDYAKTDTERVQIMEKCEAGYQSYANIDLESIAYLVGELFNEGIIEDIGDISVADIVDKYYAFYNEGE